MTGTDSRRVNGAIKQLEQRRRTAVIRRLEQQRDGNSHAVAMLGGKVAAYEEALSLLRALDNGTPLPLLRRFVRYGRSS